MCRDNYVYVTRLCNMGKNIITHSPSPCAYCNGYGYLQCHYCKYGCWRCNQSTLLRCRFCSGDGKGIRAYIKQPYK